MNKYIDFGVKYSCKACWSGRVVRLTPDKPREESDYHCENCGANIGWGGVLALGADTRIDHSNHPWAKPSQEFRAKKEAEKLAAEKRAAGKKGKGAKK